MNINNVGVILIWKRFDITIHQPKKEDIENGRDFHIKSDREFTNEELAQYETEYNDHFDSVSWIKNRENEYIKEGCTEKELIIALWERVVEGRPEASAALETKRQAVKIRIPRPTNPAETI